MNTAVRVRFAPSPTGALHIGGVRTALYNYLFARNQGGKFILRIEDTDRARLVEGAEEYINQSLEWLGITPDESPSLGGDYEPYRQSERKEIYSQYVRQLVEQGHAYYAFDTPEELEAMRSRLKAANVADLHYNAITRMQMKNALTLPESEVEDRLNSGQPYVIRLKVPKKEEIRLQDMVRGWVVVHSSAIDDKVIMKSDGMPTYHLANVVDDHLMKITHVIRGEEWLPSAPLHVILYHLLGWADSMPQFAHLPLLLKPDGNGKLSKRDGDRSGFPVFPVSGDFPDKTGNKEHFPGFREAGYLPEALVNFLALLGWNPGTQEELFSMEALIQAFSIERVGKSGAQFQIDKAKWFNQQYLKATPSHELIPYLQQHLQEDHIPYHTSALIGICDLLKERIEFPQELWQEGKFFFVKPENYDEKVTSKKWNSTVVDVLEAYRAVMASSETTDADQAKALLTDILHAKGVKPGIVMQSLRIALTGKASGPDLMKIIELLGSAEVALRISNAVHSIPVK